MQQELFEEMTLDFTGCPEETIPLLQKVQEKEGFVSEDSMKQIAAFAGVPESRVYSVATFYEQFRFTPIGRHHIMVCRGTACHIRGAPAILKQLKRELALEEGETSDDGMFSLETVACIGACGMAPNIVVNDRTYGRLTEEKVTEIINSLRSASGEEEN